MKARGSSITFPGNEKLRNAGAKVPVTQKNLQDYIRCKTDFLFFVRKFIKIETKDDGVMPFDPRPFQEELADLMEECRFVIAKIPRQYGKTSIVVAYLLWKIIFNDHFTVGIFANKEDVAKDILLKLQFSYENLPLWLQQGIKKWKAGNIVLQNGSLIKCGTTTGSSGRSGAYNIIILEEFAFVEKNIQDAFYGAAYPTITSGKKTKLFIISTPNGMNRYYKIWTDAVKGENQFKAIEVHWSALPGRDEKWKKLTIADIGQDNFDQEFGCEFIGSSGNTLVSPSKLKMIPYMNPIQKIGDFEIFIPPKENHVYTLTADVGEGVGGDYSTFSVVDITTMPYHQVAKYRSNKISQMDFPDHIMNAGVMYNYAYVLIEVNDGRTVGDFLYNELEYPHQLFTYRKYNARGQTLTINFAPNTNPGLQMSVRTKRPACSHLKHMIESDQLIIHDFDTLSELGSFVKNGPSFAADADSNDDMVMSLVMFAWLATQKFFNELSSDTYRTKIREEREKTASESIDSIVRSDNLTDDEYEIFDDCVWFSPGQNQERPIDQAWRNMGVERRGRYH